jgi:hypothetical protein
MSAVASLELCKELYELSGWRKDVEHVYYSNGGAVNPRNVWPKNEVFDKPGNIPAYSLGYLLRKLPMQYNRGILLVGVTNGDKWSAQYYSFYPPDRGAKSAILIADTPEDAAAKLAIELFKQGILKRE